MKKIFLSLLCSTTLVNSSPLICNLNLKSNSSTLSATVKFYFGNKDTYYEATFDDTQKTCEITKLYVVGTVDVWKIPSTLPRDGKEGGEPYKLTSIGVDPSFGHDIYEDKIKRLDLSEATNLQIIKKSSFSRALNKSKVPMICSVDFSGAKNLEIIEDGAFKWQLFNCTYFEDLNNNLDFSNTKLKSIGKNAFNYCCLADKNHFSKIIFPPTLESIGEGAFHIPSSSTEYKDTKMTFDKIIFTTKEPDLNNFIKSNTSLPNISNFGPNIIIPMGSSEYYKRVQNILQDSKTSYITDFSCYTESTIGWKNLYPGGEVNMESMYDDMGESKQSWQVCDKSGEKVNQCIYKLINTFDPNKIWVDEQSKKIRWNRDLSVGTYNCGRVLVYNETGIAISDPIELKVIEKISLNGGSKILIGNSYSSGSDINYWQLSPFSMVKNVEYDIDYSEAEPLKGYLDLHVEDNKCLIRWKEGIPSNTYFINLRAVVTTESGNKYTIISPVCFVCQDSYYSILIQNTDGSTIDNPITVDLNDPQQLSFNVQHYVDQQPTQGKFLKPELSVIYNGVTLKNDEIKSDGKYELTIETGTYGINQCGQIEFFILTQVQDDDYGLIPIVSNVVTLNVINTSLGTPSLTCSGGSSNLYTYKFEQGYDSNWWEVKIDGGVTNYEITNISPVPTKFTPQEEYNRLQQINFTVGQNNKKFNLNWTSKFATSDYWYDAFVFNIKVTVKNNDSGVEYTSFIPVEIVANNFATINSDGSPELFSFPLEKGIDSHKWKLHINGKEQPTEETVHFSIQNDSTNKIHLQSTTQQNEAVICWDELEVGTYYFTLVGYDYTDFVYAETNFKLVVNNRMDLVNVPENINAEQNKSGSSDKQIISILNNSKIVLPKYVFEGTFNDHFSVSIDGIISWDDKLTPGKYTLVLKAFYKTEQGDEVTTSVSIPLIVSIDPTPTPTSSDNKKKIIIICSSVGGALLVGGVTCGIVFGIKNKKNNKKRK